MAEGLMSFRDKFLALKRRHADHIERAGEGAQIVGQSIISGVAGFAMGVVDQKFAPADQTYANLSMLSVGPVPLSLLLGAAGLGAALYGHRRHWAPWAEAAGTGLTASYSYAQGRRMTIDYMSGASSSAPAASS